MSFTPQDARPGREIVFPLSGDNELRISISRPMNRADFDRLRKLIDLARPCLLTNEPAEIDTPVSKELELE